MAMTTHTTTTSASTNHRHRHDLLKVSSKSSPNSVAGAVAGVVREYGTVELQVVGAGALNQAIKALAIARGYVADSGIDLVCVPSFADIEIDGERRTAIRLGISDRHDSEYLASEDGAAQHPAGQHPVTELQLRLASEVHADE